MSATLVFAAAAVPPTLLSFGPGPGSGPGSGAAAASGRVQAVCTLPPRLRLYNVNPAGNARICICGRPLSAANAHSAEGS